MYKITVNNSVFTCKEQFSIISLALTKAVDLGNCKQLLNDINAAINYLSSIGIVVEEVEDET